MLFGKDRDVEVRRLNILTNKFFIFMILIGYLRPIGIGGMATANGGIWTTINLIFLFFKGLSIAFAFVYLSSKMLSRTAFKYLLPGFIYGALLVLSDLLNNNSDVTSTLTLAISICGITTWVYIYIKNDEIAQLLSSMATILSVIIIFNLITIIAYPNGMYINSNGLSSNWLMGYKNNFIYSYMAYLISAGLSNLLKREEISIGTYVMIALISVSLILTGSTTSIVAIVAVAFCLILFINREFFSKVRLVWVYATSIFISILVIFFSFLSNFSEVLMQLFEKDASASRRTLIWAEGIEKFLSNPIVGVGNSTRVEIGNLSQYHNKYLDLLVVGGVVLFICWVFMILLASNALEKYYIHYKIKNWFLICSIEYGILYLMEGARDDVFSLMFMSIMYMMPAMENSFEKNPSSSKKRIRIKLRLN